MKEYEDIMYYFIRIDEIVNTIRGLGETTEDLGILDKVLRTLPKLLLKNCLAMWNMCVGIVANMFKLKQVDQAEAQKKYWWW